MRILQDLYHIIMQPIRRLYQGLHHRIAAAATTTTTRPHQPSQTTTTPQIPMEEIHPSFLCTPPTPPKPAPAPIWRSAPIPCKTGTNRRRWRDFLTPRCRDPSILSAMKMETLRLNVAQVAYRVYLRRLRDVRAEMVRTRREIAKLRLKMDAAEATIRTMRLVQKRGDVDGSVCGRRSWARELDEELRRGCGRYEGSEVFDLVMGEGRLEIWYEVRMDQQCRFQALQKDIQIQRAQECCTIASIEKAETIVKREGGILEVWQRPNRLRDEMTMDNVWDEDTFEPVFEKRTDELRKADTCQILDLEFI